MSTLPGLAYGNEKIYGKLPGTQEIEMMPADEADGTQQRGGGNGDDLNSITSAGTKEIFSKLFEGSHPQPAHGCHLYWCKRRCIVILMLLALTALISYFGLATRHRAASLMHAVIPSCAVPDRAPSLRVAQRRTRETPAELSPCEPEQPDAAPLVRFPQLSSVAFPAYVVTRRPRCIHRYFDSSPFSPSGRFLAALCTPYEGTPVDWPPGPAEVLVVDLVGGTERVVATTSAWDSQLGAQVQWGRSDSELYFNDMGQMQGDGDWEAFGVQLDPLSGRSRRLPCTIYHVSLDGSYAASPHLGKLRYKQHGYGVVLPPEQLARLRNDGAPADDGIFLTDLTTGKCSLVASLSSLVSNASLPQPASGGGGSGGSEANGGSGDGGCSYYGFHTKFSAASPPRLMFVVYQSPGCVDHAHDKHSRIQGEANHVFTLGLDGGSPRRVVTWDAMLPGVGRLSGNHPNWNDEGTHITMNLGPCDNPSIYPAALSVCELPDVAGAACRVLSPRGSGHPLSRRASPLLIVDTYSKEWQKFGIQAGASALRLVDGSAPGHESLLGSFQTSYPALEKEQMHAWRCDLHPAWDAPQRRLAFNVRVGRWRHVAVMLFPNESVARALADGYYREANAMRRK